MRALVLIFVAAASLEAQQLAAIQVTRIPSGPVVPNDFIGFSIQQNAALTFFGPSTSDNSVLFTLIRNLGAGTLRIGGAAADYSCWSGEPAPNPAECQYSLTSTDFESWANASLQTGWPMLLGVNLVQNEAPGAPQYIVNEVTNGILPALAGHAKQELLGLELGNELNLYVMQGYRPQGYSVPGQASDLLAYIGALKANSTTKSINLAAPAYYNPSVSTITNQLDPLMTAVLQCSTCSPKNLGIVTLHEYALNLSSAPVTISQLLAPTLIASIQQSFSKAVHDMSAQFHLPVQIDETNTAAPDPGQPGVSDVQASALWALDYALDMARIGIRRINFHFHQGSVYDPIQITNNGANSFIDQVEPEYYALYAFNAAKGEQFLPVTVTAGAANIRAYALSSCASCAITVYLINKDMTAAGPVQITLSTPATAATYLELSAPSLSSTSASVTYGETQFNNSTGALNGTPVLTPIQPDSNGSYTVNLDNAAAGILTIQP